MVKDVVGKLLLTLIFSLTLWFGFAPSALGSIGPVWPVPLLGITAALVFAWWQPDGFPFHRGEKGPGFASAALGAHIVLVACLFGLGRLASTTLF